MPSCNVESTQYLSDYKFALLQVLTTQLMTALRKKRRHFYEDIERCILHHDNATPHTARETRLTLDVMGMETLPHPPYSPDLAPCDFALFPYLKKQLRGTNFQTLGELQQACTKTFSALSRDWFGDVFRKWVSRHERCVLHQGRYFEKE